jgi:DNA-binding PadR family transcriptional regulator
VRAAILALLREEPRNGYQIMSEIEERSGGAWRPSPGAVYPALAQLADEGLIAGVESGGRRTFELTEAGQRHIADNPESARPAWEAMAEGPPGEVRGLLTQAARLGGSVAQIAHAGTPEQIRAAAELLASTRRGIYQILAGDGESYVDGDGDGEGYGDSDGEGYGDSGGYRAAGEDEDVAETPDEAEMDEETGHG